jgi:hypothetical protein
MATKKHKRLPNLGGLLCIFAACGVFAAQEPVQENLSLDLRSIPISDWLNGNDTTEIPWSVRIRPATLGMDQRLEVFYTVSIRAKALNSTGKSHELFLISRFSTLDGEWLNAPDITRHEVDGEMPNHLQALFNMRVSVQPGEYLLWLVLYDRKTDKHNVTKRRIKVSEMRGDPLPLLYNRLPLIEFPKITENGPSYINSEYFLPIANKRPMQVELISMFSPPEQWASRSRAIRVYHDNTVGALSALAQMELRDGSMSITGLDLARREMSFEQRDFEKVDWPSLLEALKKAQSPNITAAALQGSKSNGAFFREFLDQRLAPDENASGEDPLRVIIVVSSSLLFQRGSDLKPIEIEGDCNCRIYHVRFRLTNSDVFDELERFMKPLRPRTFNPISPRDFRKAIAEIVEELESL